MQVTIKLRTLIGMVLIAIAGYVQVVNPTIHWPGIDWIVPGGDAPIKEPGFRVLIVEETKERNSLKPGQLNAMLSKASGGVRDYCDKHCVKDGNATAFRLIDKDGPFDKEPKWVTDTVSHPRTSLPWLVVSNGKSGKECPLPENEADTLALLKKYGGQ